MFLQNFTCYDDLSWTTFAYPDHTWYESQILRESSEETKNEPKGCSLEDKFDEAMVKLMSGDERELNCPLDSEMNTLLHASVLLNR